MLLLNQNVYERRREHKMTSWKDRLALTAQRNRQEIVKAKLDRREMMRLGLLTAGGSLIAKAGLSSRAFGAAGLTEKDPTLIRQPPSPPAQPWKAPMPRLTVKTPVNRPRHAVRHARRHHADRRGNQADPTPVLLVQRHHRYSTEPGPPAASYRRSSMNSRRRRRTSSCIPTMRPPPYGRSTARFPVR